MKPIDNKNKNKSNRLVIKGCVEEIAAVVAIARKPLTRKTYLTSRKWYNFQKSILEELKYKGEISKFPKHKPKPEDPP